MRDMNKNYSNEITNDNSTNSTPSESKSALAVSLANIPDIQQLPDITVNSTHGTFNLATLNGNYTLLYFYPKDLTPGCTTQGQNFRDRHDQPL